MLESTDVAMFVKVLEGQLGEVVLHECRAMLEACTLLLEIVGGLLISSRGWLPALLRFCFL